MEQKNCLISSCIFPEAASVRFDLYPVRNFEPVIIVASSSDLLDFTVDIIKGSVNSGQKGKVLRHQR